MIHTVCFLLSLAFSIRLCLFTLVAVAVFCTFSLWTSVNILSLVCGLLSKDVCMVYGFLPYKQCCTERSCSCVLVTCARVSLSLSPYWWPYGHGDCIFKFTK